MPFLAGKELSTDVQRASSCRSLGALRERNHSRAHVGEYNAGDYRRLGLPEFMNVSPASVGYGLRYFVSPSLCGDGVSYPLFT